MLNFDHALDQLRGVGLILDRDVVVDGRIQRWRVDGEDRERRGWSRLREWTSRHGNTYVVGAYGVWHGTDDGYTKIELPPRDDNAPALDDDDRRALREAQKAARKAIAEQRKVEAKTAAQWAASVWAHCAPATDHEYLTRKRIGPHGARVLEGLDGMALPDLDDSNLWRLQQAVGALVVPMHDAVGQVCGIQFIYPAGHARKAKLGRDKEFWPAGMAMGGTFGLIGALPAGGVLLVTEGFATAASLREATGYPVAYAFSANNLAKACREIRRKARSVRLLLCADDDYLTDGNPGTSAAAAVTAELEHTAWIKPDFSDADGNDIRGGKKLTDFNDLAVLTGVPLALADQVNQVIEERGWIARAAATAAAGGGDGAMPSLISVEEAVARYWGVYGLGGKVLFDEVERRLVHRDDVMNIIPPRSWDLIKSHPGWRVARDSEIGFDPTEADTSVKCNLFGGWPTEPRPGRCEALLGLLEYLCMWERNADDVYSWVLKWLAYPLQNRGAKMHSAIVVHGPQGTGKSRFFEVYGKIYGPYSRVLNQEALEDKFNADWAEKKLFILADEVLARAEMYHVKNRLKGFITGDSIRVNPKNVAAHVEKNQMNIVFLSNERMPVAIENDDRRHCVLWSPPKLGDDYYRKVDEEIDNGGVEALYHYLLNVDLGDFKPWTRPPMTKAKDDLVQLGRSSEERFLREWMALELEAPNGDTLPFCPCLGSSLYQAYSKWCEVHGERRRGAKDLISLCGKQPGWTAGAPMKTHPTLRADDRAAWKNRKLVVPSSQSIEQAYQHSTGDERAQVLQSPDETKGLWLTRCFFHFEKAMGAEW
jgi:putative DNA primase/helicase